MINIENEISQLFDKLTKYRFKNDLIEMMLFDKNTNALKRDFLEKEYLKNREKLIKTHENFEKLILNYHSLISEINT